MKRVFSAILLISLLVVVYLAGRYHVSGVSGPVARDRQILYYVDPMHPSYKSEKPGTAPDCGMQLEPVYADQMNSYDSGSDKQGSLSNQLVKIDLEQQQLIGIQIDEVKRTSGYYHLAAPGRVVVDDTRTYRITAGIDGIVLATYDHSIGSLVRKDEVLALFNSPEFLTTETNFLASWLRAPENKHETASPGEWKDQTVRLGASRLRGLGMTDNQLNELVKTQRIADTIEVAAPVNGIIVARNISAGQRVEKGAEFYRIADLTRVWVLASLREDEADGIRPGTEVKISLPDHGKRWTARVSNAVPQFDPLTRTLQLRLEMDNPGLVLRPDMFVNVDMEVHVPAALTIPTEALLDSGISKVVYIDRGNGAFEPRQIQTGRRSGTRIEVVSGLAPGEKIVVSGTFLLDSESRLRFPQRAVASHVMPVSSAGLPKSATDPACGMEVEPAESVAAGNTETYQDKTYYFCSRSCRDTFRKDPQALISRANSHAAAAAPGMKGERGAAHD